MRMNWWMVPLAILLVLAGVAGGLMLARPRAPVPGTVGKVTAPSAGEKKPAPKPQIQPQPHEPPPKEPEPKEPEPKELEHSRPPNSEAQAFIRAFMEARMAGDAATVASMVGPQAVGKGSIRLSGPGARITGYTAGLLGTGDVDLFVFRLKVGFATGQPGGEVAAEEIRLTWQGGLKVVAYTEQAKETLTLGVGQDGKLYLHRGQDTAVAGDLSLLPAKAKPWGAGPGIEFGVGAEGWSVAAVTTAGSHVLWVTKGHHPLLGISQITWGSNPVMTPLDLLFEAGAVDAAWAPGGARYVAVATAQASGATTLTIYDVTASQKYGPDLSAALGGGQDFAVRNIRWVSGTVVAFDVVQGGATVKGPYAYDVASRQLKQP
ncbi:MAG TPA: hypothetical protein VD969_04195 [Symbiobacteriaceae bacterium]|nr:hypothetical protein [Symbiobacteriaceae bacterium]